jgi:Holliday junction resolvase RusA-like endonuclease
MLPSDLKIPDGAVKITIEFGFSNAASDLDNPVKPFLDSLKDRYGFDDKKVYELFISKKIVKKGQDYIKYKIEPSEIG